MSGSARQALIENSVAAWSSMRLPGKRRGKVAFMRSSDLAKDDDASTLARAGNEHEGRAVGSCAPGCAPGPEQALCRAQPSAPRRRLKQDRGQLAHKTSCSRAISEEAG